MAKTTPIVRGTTLTYQQDGQEQVLLVETPAWYAWLETASSFAFKSQAGNFTARKERAGNQRGGWYWKAYCTHHGKLTSHYLGKSETITLARLQAVAQTLADALVETAPDNDADEARSSAQAAAPAIQGDSLTTLLSTKLHLPRPRVQLVPRPHLLERLQQGMAGVLTLLSAPAGFGKTTLLAQWQASTHMPVAWLSLDAQDNDPTRFLAYLIAALQTLDTQLGTTALALLHAPQPPPSETVLAALTNDLVERGGGDVALVLDDYHLITADPIQRSMTFLLEHLPPHLHLLLASRADPPLFPLARLRAQGQLCEVRTADLRFADAEVRAFLQTVMGLDLSPEAIATLESRTEGWIAGLQLAALSLQGRTDVAGFLAAFRGSHRFVLDYLSQEVLARQPATVQRFLLHTCLLERLNGPLCDAVTEQEGSRAILEALERANLFVVALDDERGWYRYHHLFAQVLHHHLQQAEPMLVPELHRRASAWYEQNALAAEAVQHALAVPDFERAARLIELIALPLTFQGQISTVLGWMNALPEALIRAHPLLCVQQATYMMFTNQLQAAEARLAQAEQTIQKGMPTEQARTTCGYVRTIRSGIANLSGDILHGVSFARQALDLLPETAVLLRMGALVTTAHAFLASGDVTPESEHEVAAAAAVIRAGGNLLAIERIEMLLGWLYALQGRLRRAATAYAQVGQALPGQERLPFSFNGFIYHFALGDLLRERNELEAAEEHLTQGMGLINETLTLEPSVALLGYTALARLQQARRNSRAALATLDALAQVAEQRHYPAIWRAQGDAVRAQLEVALGNLGAAIRWADASGLSLQHTDLSYLHERAYLALARVRIAQRREDPAAPLLQDVLRLLDRLRVSAEVIARKNSVLEILVLSALAQQAQGDQTAALTTLERALVLAEPEGYMRLFVDEGAPMLALLRQAQIRAMVPDYVATLLSAFSEHTRMNPAVSTAHSSSLVELFTEREREVLRLLLAGASNREIAHHLVISVNTVKKHVHNICGKLGVHSRAQAIVRTRTLTLP